MDRDRAVKRLGIVGGIGPGSTIDYYRLLVAAYREERPDGTWPPILIDSIDLSRLLRLVEADRLAELADWLLDELGRLSRAGADFAILASNTPHIVFDDLRRRSPLPLLSIVEASAAAATRAGATRVGLLGTRFTMQGRFYPEVFARRGIAVRAPAPDDLEWVHARYMGELLAGDFREETRRGFLAVIARLREDGADAVVLAGTELPLLLRDAPDAGVPLLDTTDIHVRRVIREMLGHEKGPAA